MHRTLSSDPSQFTFHFIVQTFGKHFSLNETDQELSELDNWAFCHRLQIIARKEKLFLDSYDCLFERIVTEAIEGGAALHLIVGCFWIKFHSAIERRLSVTFQQNVVLWKRNWIWSDRKN
jgi:hypothetical protein